MEPSPNIRYCYMNSASAYEHVRLWALPKGVIFCLWARIFILHVLSFAKKCDVLYVQGSGIILTTDATVFKENCGRHVSGMTT